MGGCLLICSEDAVGVFGGYVGVEVDYICSEGVVVDGF